jgi:hypothetical protein
LCAPLKIKVFLKIKNIFLMESRRKSLLLNHFRNSRIFIITIFVNHLFPLIAKTQQFAGFFGISHEMIVIICFTDFKISRN